MANPTLMPSASMIAIPIVILAAFVVEVMLTALVLAFWGLISTPLVGVLFVGNAVVYGALFMPLLLATKNVPAAEAVVIVLDALFIKLLSRFAWFQTNDFKRLPWFAALLAAAIGNMASMTVGFALS
jgi:hypothetical protein